MRKIRAVIDCAYSRVRKVTQGRVRVAQSFKVKAAAMLVVVVVGSSAPSSAQWFKFPTPGTPRTKNGDVNLSAPTPRLADGKPDLSGVWMTAEPGCGVGGPASVTELQATAASRKCPVRGA